MCHSLTILLSWKQLAGEGVELSLSSSRIRQEFPVTVAWPNIPAGPLPSPGNTRQQPVPQGTPGSRHWEFTEFLKQPEGLEQEFPA